ncbi:hypothetical protein VPH35_085967 [Triticum aestivum]
MQMAFSSFLLPPPSPPLPSPAAAAASASASTSSSSYPVAAHRGRRLRGPRCRCGRSPEVTPATTTSSGSGDRGSCDEEDASAPPTLPVEPVGGVASTDSLTGSATPRYQATSTKGDTRNEDLEKWENNQRGTDGLSSSKSKSAYSKAFGVDLSPDNVAVATVYFVQGVLGLSRLAVSFYLKDDLQLDPAETAVITGFSALPWLVKPLYGFISDSVPLFGYRRRSYLILSGLLGAISWSLMATIVDDKYSAALSIILGSLAVAFSDVVVDSMVVERTRGESQSTSGSLQSLCWGSSAFGAIVSAYFSGSLVDTYGVRFVFGVTAFLPLMTSAVAVLVNEKRLPTEERSISLSSSSTNKIGFTPEFLGRVTLVTSVASLLGVGIYNSFLKAVPLRKIFLVTTILGSALGMTQVLFSAYLF